jgi:RNA polymerase sigma-70 factor (ECF subfamily)
MWRADAIRRQKSTALGTPAARSVPQSDDSDRSLVRAARAGDAAAFGELVARYQDRVYTLVRARLPHREDALDVTQEVFLKVFRNLESFREEAVFATWLYRIALNSCIDFARRHARSARNCPLEAQVPRGPAEPADPRPQADPERCLVDKERNALLWTCLQALPEPMRLAVILHDVEGLSQEETAAALGCPLGTAKSRIQRGRGQLRERLKRCLAA